VREPDARYLPLPEDIRTKILEVQEKAGFVPNVFLALARRPAEWRAFFAYHDALMIKEEGSQPQRLIDQGRPRDDRHHHQCGQPVPVLRGGAWCPAAHLRKKPLVADQVAVNYRKADITPRQRAMLDFAMKVCQRSHEIDDGDFAALHAHGFDDEDVWDIAAITAFFGLSNRMASFSNMMPNPEFYLLGRVPKSTVRPPA
jgi:alkylhydroperoxidase family enzyme